MKLFDFHIHTIYSSDSSIRPSHLIKIVNSMGIGSIAITDHNTIKGAVKAKEINNTDVEIIIGSEIKTDYGDIIGLNLNCDIKHHHFYNVIDELRTQGATIILPHPMRNHKNVEEICNAVDIIEGLNGRSSISQNFKSMELANLYSKPIIGGSDAHSIFEVGTIINEISGHDNLDDFDCLSIKCNPMNNLLSHGFSFFNKIILNKLLIKLFDD